MAGIPSIPPLLCNTPPPIDFGEEDDDSGLPPTLTLEDEDDYGDFPLGTDINEDTTTAEVSSLPRTPQFELSSSTTSGFTDIPPAFEDCGTLSLTPTELNNSAANDEDKTEIQLNEAFNYNVTQRFSSTNGENNNNTQTADAMTELKQIHNSNTPSAKQNVNDNKPLDFDSNEANFTTTTSNLQVQSVSVSENSGEITTKPDSQVGDSNATSSEQEIEVKSNFMPIISQSPPPLTNVVLLEDLADDSSDEECHRSPKRSPISITAPLADNVDNDSEDFFAIHVVNTPPKPKDDTFSTIAGDINMNNTLNHNNNNTSDLPNTINANLNDSAEHDDEDDDFGDFADFETASDLIKPTENSGLVTADSIPISLVDSNENVEALVEPPPETAFSVDDNDDDDFDDFQDFASAPAPTPAVVPTISAPHALSITAENNNTNTQFVALKIDSVAPEVRKEVQSEANSFDNDDDDDFGDFEEATFETPTNQFTSNAPILQTPTTATTSYITNNNIGERLGSVLKMMFPTEEEHRAEAKELQQTVKVANNMNETLPLEAIEAAKALEFQWPQSEMRHALIRSIGIDSRNILFGDNWNPSMPRFAANLSFNPLKPMKPQTDNTVPNTTTYADADTMQYSSVSAAEPDISSYAKKTDVPDVEFDWQGAGLVNPLDASHVHTLLLDLDQVMVVATKLDNLTVDSSSYSSFSACATLERIATTTTTNNTTVNNNLIKQMQRLNVTPQTTNTTTTILTTPICVPTAQSSSSSLTARTALSLSSSSSTSSSSQSPTPSLLNNKNNNNNPTITANATHIFYSNAKQQHRTNTNENVCTPHDHQTNALTCCKTTTHAIAAHNAFLHSLNTYVPLQTLAANGTVGNINTVEPFLYLNNFTNHLLAINQNHIPAMNNNKNTYNNNQLYLNTNINERIAMSNPKTTATINATLKCADICNNFNMPNKPLECVNFHTNSNRLLDCSRAKGETNTRETEAVQPAALVARLDTPDDEHQSHTTFASVGDNISETLSKNDNELTASPTRDDGPSPLALDNAAYQFTAGETAINTISSSTSASSISSSSKPYDNSKPMTTLRLAANIVVDDDDDDETVVTSTYAGPLKETHIYTPSKADAAATAKTSKASVSGSEPIDFDYEIAAAGIIIDEKVVKKEYRDVEYNPGFSLEVVAEYASESSVGVPGALTSEPSVSAVTASQAPQQTAEFDTDEFTEFTEFQSVPPPPASTLSVADAHLGAPLSAASTITSKFSAELNIKAPLNSQPTVLPVAVTKAKEASKTPNRTNSPSIIDNMILSPAILLPQAIPISTNNGTATTKATPTIEWGDSTASINPDELARIEELFSQPKTPVVAAAKDVMNASQKSTPIHNYAEKHTKNNSISISASVAMKEQDSTLNDDYWSEFVSVPVTPQLSSNASRIHNNNNNNNNNSNNNSNNNNQMVITPKRITGVHIRGSVNNSNNAMRSPRHHHHQQQQQNISSGQRTLTPTPQQKSAAHASTTISAKSNVYNSNCNSNSNDDDWSDFVSSTPTPASASTQQQHAASYMPAAHAPQFNSAAWQNANFYNNPLGLYHQQTVMQMRTSPLTPQQQQLQLQQQIHIMQDFSTAPVANRPLNAMSTSNNANNSNLQHSNTSYSSPHLQVGSARVAPSISLIPDLGFVAPALPVHTAFVNVLPKTSFNSKK